MPSRPIGLVLDPEFKGDLFQLASRMPVWVLATEFNDRTVARCGIRLAGRSPQGSAGVTLLEPHAGEAPCDLLARALFNIDDHHGPVTTAAAPYDSVFVYGIPPQYLTRDVMLDLGLTSVEDAKDGFIVFIDRGLRGGGRQA